jgi:hypothetical protein
VINPVNVGEFSVFSLEHINRPPVGADPGVVQHDGDIETVVEVALLGCNIHTGAIVVRHSHVRVVIEIGGLCTPDDVSGRQHSGVKIGVNNDGAMLGIPRPAQRAAVEFRRQNGLICREHCRVRYIHAVLVGKRRVGP